MFFSSIFQIIFFTLIFCEDFIFFLWLLLWTTFSRKFCFTFKHINYELEFNHYCKKQPLKNFVHFLTLFFIQFFIFLYFLSFSTRHFLRHFSQKTFFKQKKWRILLFCVLFFSKEIFLWKRKRERDSVREREGNIFWLHNFLLIFLYHSARFFSIVVLLSHM